jgi:hypothetical protein
MVNIDWFEGLTWLSPLTAAGLGRTADKTNTSSAGKLPFLEIDLLALLPQKLFARREQTLANPAQPEEASLALLGRELAEGAPVERNFRRDRVPLPEGFLARFVRRILSLCRNEDDQLDSCPPSGMPPSCSRPAGAGGSPHIPKTV